MREHNLWLDHIHMMCFSGHLAAELGKEPVECNS